MKLIGGNNYCITPTTIQNNNLVDISYIIISGMYMYGQKDKNPKVNMDKQKQNGVGSENTEDTPKLPIKGRTRGSVSNKNSQPNSRDNSRDRSDSKEWKYDKCEGIFQSETSWILECE